VKPADSRRLTMGDIMKLLRFPDLVAIGLFNSRMTLKRAIDSQGFPEGVLLTPNCRAWREDEIEAWVAARPTARKPEARSSAASLVASAA
jgi:predicted DNA-binding transcriptional regulator AlpA